MFNREFYHQSRQFPVVLIIAVSFFVFIPNSASFASTHLKSKEEKHFDINKDDRLDLYESMLYRTYKITGYPLVTKKNQKPYDINYNLMLDPVEMQMYLRDKANGRLKKNNKEDEAVTADQGSVRYQFSDQFPNQSPSKSK